MSDHAPNGMVTDGRLYLFFAITDYYPAGGFGDLAAEQRFATEDEARAWAAAMFDQHAGDDRQLWVVGHDEVTEIDLSREERERDERIYADLRAREVAECADGRHAWVSGGFGMTCKRDGCNVRRDGRTT